MLHKSLIAIFIISVLISPQLKAKNAMMQLESKRYTIRYSAEHAAEANLIAQLVEEEILRAERYTGRTRMEPVTIVLLPYLQRKEYRKKDPLLPDSGKTLYLDSWYDYLALKKKLSNYLVTHLLDMRKKYSKAGKKNGVSAVSLLPLWYSKALAEYVATDYEYESLPKLSRAYKSDLSLTLWNVAFSDITSAVSYSFFYFIESKYGKEKIVTITDELLYGESLQNAVKYISRESISEFELEWATFISEKVSANEDLAGKPSYSDILVVSENGNSVVRSSTGSVLAVLPFRELRDVIQSDDGTRLYFVAATTSQLDLYSYNTLTKEIRRLTDNYFVEKNPQLRDNEAALRYETNFNSYNLYASSLFIEYECDLVTGLHSRVETEMAASQNLYQSEIAPDTLSYQSRKEFKNSISLQTYESNLIGSSNPAIAGGARVVFSDGLDSMSFGAELDHASRREEISDAGVSVFGIYNFGQYDLGARLFRTINQRHFAHEPFYLTMEDSTEAVKQGGELTAGYWWKESLRLQLHTMLYGAKYYKGGEAGSDNLVIEAGPSLDYYMGYRQSLIFHSGFALGAKSSLLQQSDNSAHMLSAWGAWGLSPLQGIHLQSKTHYATLTSGSGYAMEMADSFRVPGLSDFSQSKSLLVVENMTAFTLFPKVETALFPLGSFLVGLSPIFVRSEERAVFLPGAFLFTGIDESYFLRLDYHQQMSMINVGEHYFSLETGVYIQ